MDYLDYFYCDDISLTDVDIMDHHQILSELDRYRLWMCAEQTEMDHCTNSNNINSTNLFMCIPPSSTHSAASSSNGSYRTGESRASSTQSRPGASSSGTRGATLSVEILRWHYGNDLSDDIDDDSGTSLWKLNTYSDCDSILKGLRKNVNSIQLESVYRYFFDWYQRFCKAYSYQFTGYDYLDNCYTCLTCGRTSDFADFACSCQTYKDKLDDIQIKAFINATCEFRQSMSDDEIPVELITNASYFYYFADRPIVCSQRDRPFVSFHESWRLGDLSLAIKSWKRRYFLAIVSRLMTRQLPSLFIPMHSNVSVVIWVRVFLAGEIDATYPP